MSLLHRQLKYGKSSAAQRSFKAIAHGRREAMGLPRTLATAATLIFAMLASYVAILYLLPIASPKQILGISQQNYAAAAMEDTREGWLRNTIMKPFELRRTFLGKRQGIRAHYVIPKGMVVDLNIEHCQRAIIVEAFKCRPIGTSSAHIDSGIGTKMFKFSRVGFYQFNDQLRHVESGALASEVEKEGYRIIWKRD